MYWVFYLREMKYVLYEKLDLGFIVSIKSRFFKGVLLNNLPEVSFLIVAAVCEIRNV